MDRKKLGFCSFVKLKICDEFFKVEVKIEVVVSF